MSLIVPFLGLLIVAMGLAVVVNPAFLRRLMKGLVRSHWIYAGAALRIVIGALFMLVAEETRFPTFILSFGVLLIVAGISKPLVGLERIARLISWSANRSNGFLRLWAIVALLLGAALIWAGPQLPNFTP